MNLEGRLQCNSILTTRNKKDKLEKRKREYIYPLFFFFIVCLQLSSRKKKENLVDTVCKHQQIKKKLFAFNNSKRPVDSTIVDRESYLNGVTNLEWPRSVASRTKVQRLCMAFL